MTIMKVMTTETIQLSPSSTPLPLTQNVSSVEPQKLIDTLYFIWEAFDRANIPFFLVHETAEQAMKGHSPVGDHVDVGMRLMEWRGGSQRILEDVIGKPESFHEAESEESYSIAKYSHDGVPFYLYIYPDAPCIMQLDSINYRYEWFRVPNPYSQFKELYGL